MDSELRSVVLAVVAAAVITPLLGRWLSRAFPPMVRDDEDVSEHRFRNAAIEWIGTLFFIVGASVPFLIQGTDRLPTNATNAVLMLSFGALFTVGSVVLMTRLCGDRNAESFLSYIESKRGIGRAGVRAIARGMVNTAVLALVTVLLLNA